VANGAGEKYAILAETITTTSNQKAHWPTTSSMADTVFGGPSRFDPGVGKDSPYGSNFPVDILTLTSAAARCP
jgi:hypothetical protein